MVSRSTQHQFPQVVFGRFPVVTTVGQANPLGVSQISLLDVFSTTVVGAEQATALELVVLLAHSALHYLSHGIPFPRGYIKIQNRVCCLPLLGSSKVCSTQYET